MGDNFPNVLGPESEYSESDWLNSEWWPNRGGPIQIGFTRGKSLGVRF